MSVARLSIRRPVTTVMLFVSMVVLGLIAAVRLPLEAMPDVSAPFVYVMLPYAGSTPEENERTLLRPAEEALATMKGVKSLQGTATAQEAGIFVAFTDWSRDIALATADARERIDAIRRELPDDFRRYMVFKWSSADQAMLRVRLSSQTLDLTGEYARIERDYKRRLERIPGVAKVEVFGAPASEVEIAVNPDRMTAHGITLSAVAAQLQAVNFSVSAGDIHTGDTRLRVRPAGELASLDALRTLRLDRRGTTLADIAEVRLQPVEQRSERRLDGRPSVTLEVFKERDANLVEVSRAVKAELAALEGRSGTRDIHLRVVEDQGEAVAKSLLSLAEAGAIGLLLSVIVLYFFLRDWAATLMVTLSIPICFVMTLGFMYFAGISLNVLSMMGLLLAIGMLVDNAVVVVESIWQEREKHPGAPQLAAIVGTRHVAIALSAGTLSSCMVFLPNLFGERNVISIYLSQIAFTISVSLLASWLVAVSLIPMLAARLKSPPLLQQRHGLIHRLQQRYEKLLRATLAHRRASIAAIIAVALVSIVPMTQTKTDMFGGEEAGSVYVNVQWKDAYSLAQMRREMLRLEAHLEARRAQYGIKQISTRFGEGGGAGIHLDLGEQVSAQATSEITEAIRKDLPQSAMATFSMGWQGGQGSSGQMQTQEVQLVGDSTQTLKALAEDILPMLERRRELRDVRVNVGDRNSELVLRVDRERAAAFGFNAQEVANFVGMALRGQSLREMRRGESEVAVTLRFAGARQTTVQALEAFTLKAADGRELPLSALVSLAPQAAANVITHTNRQTTLALTARPAPGVTGPEARAALEAVLEGVSWPAGYHYSFEGINVFDSDEAGKRMLFNLVIALIMIYVVMAAVFESLLFPSAIMSGVVFSLFGVYWLFWMTGTSFNIMALIGILVLMGVVVNNGIVMVEHINTHRRAGMSRTEALVAGSCERLRPILMTMGTAILAMIPIAIGDTRMAGDGPSYYPMARAIAGGLAFSTVVSLLFLPTIYAVLDDWRLRQRALWQRARGKAAAAGQAAGT